MAAIATFCHLDKNLCAWQGFAHQYIINRIDVFRMPVRLMGLQFCISELTLTLLYELMKCQFHVFSSSGIPNTWLGHHRSRGAYLQAEVSKRGVVCYYSTSGGSGGWVIGSDKEDNLDKNCTAELLRLRNYILAIAIFFVCFYWTFFQLYLLQIQDFVFHPIWWFIETTSLHYLVIFVMLIYCAEIRLGYFRGLL